MFASPVRAGADLKGALQDQDVFASCVSVAAIGRTGRHLDEDCTGAGLALVAQALEADPVVFAGSPAALERALAGFKRMSRHSKQQ